MVGQRLKPFRSDVLSVDPPALKGGLCALCQATAFPPLQVCPKCGSFDVHPTSLSREGVVYSYTIVRQAPAGVAVPYVLGYVDLPEGVRVLTQIDVKDVGLVRIGMPVVLELHVISTDVDGSDLAGFRFVPADQTGVVTK